MNAIELNVNDFKAIKKANITLDGITVLSGINGSGKSSLSKLLYFSFKYANDFSKLPSKAEHQILEIQSAINSFRYDPYIRSYFRKNSIKSFYQLNVYPGSASDDIKMRYLTILRHYKELYEADNADISNRNGIDRIRYISEDVLGKKLQDKSVPELMDLLAERLKTLYEDLDKWSQNRPYKDYKDRLEDLLRASIKEVTIKEYGVPFVGKGVTSVPLLHYIQNVVYIDTPMIVANDRSFNVEHWSDLERFLEMPKTRYYSRSIYKILKEEIIHGKSENNTDDFGDTIRYKRDDGQSFPLFDSATGVKSFSVLQMLLRNGSINKNSLIIIDEPEAHLHPQWIIEYARIVVKMHKLLGTKFFIASHSTDFISAIKAISERERVSNSLRYYLSEEVPGYKYDFAYRDLGLNIEPIFASFNKSYEKLDAYGK